MQINRRHLLGGVASGTFAVAVPAVAAAAPFTPEQFGAKGDGLTNDTDAFDRLARAVTASGGGTIALRKTTYLVGRQLRGHAARTGYAFEPASILNFVGLRGALIIRGNGARLRCAPGLRYGTFDDRTGAATRNPMPYLKGGELASPYRAMIRVENCAGAVEISDVELDGGLKSLRIGGQYGDVGWQIPATGILLVGNEASERIARVYSHHHALDGITIDGADRSRGSTAASIIEDVRCEYNGRQGLSLVGGRGYAFSRCKFNHTGKAGLASAPGAGVDVEAEGGKKVRDVSFVDCEFSNNTGAGFVADSGDSEGISFRNCSLIGTTNWAAWLRKPVIRLANCTFVGSIVHAYGHPRPERATQFFDCTFRDDPRLSPTREIYGGENPERPIADLPSNENVVFHRCKFLLTHNSVLPWSTNVTYSDCTLSQAVQRRGYPRGRYIGRNSIKGLVGLYSSTIVGELILNGVHLPRGRVR